MYELSLVDETNIIWWCYVSKQILIITIFNSSTLNNKHWFGKRSIENCKLTSLKVVAVAYERWSLTTASNYSDLTEESLVSLKSTGSPSSIYNRTVEL